MWPFSRKPKPMNPGPINEDWRVGDLAECVIRERFFWNPGGVGPENGDVLKVCDVAAGTWPVDGKAYWGLQFATYAGAYFSAARFRKVPPLNSEATAEFTAQIKALKPKRVRT